MTTNSINNKQNHYQAGATLTEAIYVLPIFFIIIFGMVEMTFVYKAKNTLNLATSEAVRKGALNNAHLNKIQDALSEGMAPLYAAKKTCPGVYGTLAPPGLICARFMQSAINTSGRKAVTILSPSKEIFDAFKKNLKTTVEGDPNEKKQFIIPNDNLKWRSPVLKTVKIGGTSRGINIQDANLLKIKTLWCQKLSVPGLDLVFYNAILKNSTSPEQIYCNNLSLNTTAAGPSTRIFGQSRGYYIAIRSQGIARMQSPVHLAAGNLLTSEVIEKIIDPDIPPVEPPHECDPNTETCPPPEECDPNTETCPPPEECDPNTETCPPPEECDPTTQTCPEECPENHIPNPSPLAITKCIADPVYCAANPADSICPCDKTEQNSSPVSNSTPITN